MKAIVTKAKIVDIPILNKISVQAKSHWNYPQEWIDLWMDDLCLEEDDFNTLSIYKLMLEGDIIGFCAVEEAESYYEVEHLWILPEHMGRGYGKLLLDETLKQVVQQSKEIRVLADPYAEAFYKKQGFKTYQQIESTPKGRYLPYMNKPPQ